MDHRLVRLSKTMSHALRHAPEVYDLTLDPEGWVYADDLLAALRSKRQAWASLTLDDIRGMMAQSDKERYEIRGEYIRARYGHSVDGKLAYTPAEPPAILYHGTAARNVAPICDEGLRPMNRQFVHLSPDRVTAQQVGQRKGGETVLLIVDASTAYRDGIDFYEGNESTWLADRVPPRYINACEESNS